MRYGRGGVTGRRTTGESKTSVALAAWGTHLLPRLLQKAATAWRTATTEDARAKYPPQTGARYSPVTSSPPPPGWRAGQVIYLRFVARGASCEKEKPRESDAINAERYKYQAYSVGPYTASLVLEDQVDNQRDHGHGDVTNAHRPGFQGRRSVGTVGER